MDDDPLGFNFTPFCFKLHSANKKQTVRIHLDAREPEEGEEFDWNNDKIFNVAGRQSLGDYLGNTLRWMIYLLSMHV